MRHVIAVMVAIGIGNLGCVPLAVAAIRKGKMNSRLEEIRQQVEPLMGQPPENVVVALGPPSHTFNLGAVTVYRYTWNGAAHSFAAQSTSASGSCYGVNCHGRATGYGSGTEWQDSDQIDITFRDDIAISWRANVQR